MNALNLDGTQQRASVENVRVFMDGDGGFDIQVQARVRATGKPARANGKAAKGQKGGPVVSELIAEIEAG